ncbi:MAG: hypothetical protein DRJ41_01805 [Thermoprotei archaeon]|nr:MAG: hypothetical protein DRJ41_01805 [Thermoprotei archaeon]
MPYWAKHHLMYLKRWKEAARAILRAAKDLGLRAEIYVIGGAAEGRLTVLSDVDVLLCVKDPSLENDLRKLRVEVLAKAMDSYGLPWDYPVELHVYAEEECKDILSRLKRYVKVLEEELIYVNSNP